MQVFIVGSQGYIGRASAISLKAAGFKVRPVSSSFDREIIHLNLLRSEKFPYNTINAEDVVLVTAAVSSPDICLNQYDMAKAVNVVGTGYFVERCLDRGARVLFFSSDTVYGPGEVERSETAHCHPSGGYAVMKREVEARFEPHPAFKILRLSYVFSREDKFTAYLMACSRECKVAEIFHPLSRRSVYLVDLLDLLEIICRSWEKVTDRIINVCGPELLSRVDMTNLFREVVSPSLHFKVVKPPPDFFVARPSIINMSDRNFTRVLGRLPRTIRDAFHAEFDVKEVIL